MKIALVVNTSWNIHNFRMSLIRRLMAEGHEVHTIAPVDEYTVLLTEAGCIHHDLKMDGRGANPLKDLALVFEFVRLYKKIKPDTILHYTVKPNVYGTLAATLLRIPVINNVCGLGTVFLKKNLLSFIATSLYRVSFPFAGRVFFQNPDDLDLFVKRNLVSAGVADLVPGSGIDLQKFQPTPFKRNKQFTFLLISRLITDKGVLEYVEAARKLKAAGFEANFRILGAKDPEHKRGIKSAVIDEWIKTNVIEYLGTTSDVRPHINDADCVVLPSYREGTPRALLEAASCAKPIIATNVPGCNNVVVDNYNGLLCKLKDAGDLADKMKQMAGFEDNKLKQFGLNGRQHVLEQFDESLVIAKYLKALREVFHPAYTPAPLAVATVTCARMSAMGK
jgi:glycosyltransferase involved in cell wall biosynthesis